MANRIPEPLRATEAGLVDRILWLTTTTAGLELDVKITLERNAGDLPLLPVQAGANPNFREPRNGKMYWQKEMEFVMRAPDFRSVDLRFRGFNRPGLDVTSEETPNHVGAAWIVFGGVAEGDVVTLDLSHDAERLYLGSVDFDLGDPRQHAFLRPAPKGVHEIEVTGLP